MNKEQCIALEFTMQDGSFVNADVAILQWDFDPKKYVKALIDNRPVLLGVNCIKTARYVGGVSCLRSTCPAELLHDYNWKISSGTVTRTNFPFRDCPADIYAKNAPVLDNLAVVRVGNLEFRNAHWSYIVKRGESYVMHSYSTWVSVNDWHGLVQNWAEVYAQKELGL